MTAEELRASIKEEYPDQFYYEINPPPLQFVFFLVATGPEKKIGPVPGFFFYFFLILLENGWPILTWIRERMSGWVKGIVSFALKVKVLSVEPNG